MKQCKIVHINDGKPDVRTNGNFYFSESYPRMEEELESYLKLGFEVKAMVPVITPGEPEGGYLFYRSGYTFYLEREVAEEDINPDLDLEPHLEFDFDEDFDEDFDDEDY